MRQYDDLEIEISKEVDIDKIRLLVWLYCPDTLM